MPDYTEIDGIVLNWVEANGFSLFSEWAGEPARYFHLPGTPPYECFQVSIEPPSAGRVSVAARAIDTNNISEDELERHWHGSTGDLESMLRQALETVQEWKDRLEGAR